MFQEFGISWPSEFCSRYDPGRVTLVMMKGPFIHKVAIGSAACLSIKSWFDLQTTTFCL
jgi:hypothetical protein